MQVKFGEICAMYPNNKKAWLLRVGIVMLQDKKNTDLLLK